VRLLIVEDEADLAQMLADGLRHEGFGVDVAGDGASALALLGTTDVDVVVLDRDLPVLHGDAVCRALVAAGHPARILMLTASGTLSDRVTGLDLGADDYLAKPFAMQELVARVRALGRRYAEEPEMVLRVGDLSLNLANQEVHRGERRIELSTRELTLLKVLMREPGRVFTRTELCERVWEREHEYDMKLVEVFVGRLRKKIGAPPLIHTVRHVGYTVREAEQE